MGTRRKSRELTMQALYYLDINRDFSKKMLDQFDRNFTCSKKVLPFFMELVNGVINAKEKIDKVIETYSSNWKISRMSCVDRNIIRIAVFELLYCDDIPPKVSINEAIDIGKRLERMNPALLSMGSWTVSESLWKMIEFRLADTPGAVRRLTINTWTGLK